MSTAEYFKGQINRRKLGCVDFEAFFACLFFLMQLAKKVMTFLRFIISSEGKEWEKTILTLFTVTHFGMCCSQCRPRPAAMLQASSVLHTEHTFPAGHKFLSWFSSSSSNPSFTC